MLMSLKGDLAIASIEEKYGFINKVGEFVIEAKYDEVQQFSEGLAVIKLKGKYGYIDLLGNIIVEPKYDAANLFIEGRATVKNGYYVGIYR